MIGFGEIVVIILVCVVIFIFVSPKRIPELARALGKAVHEFKKAKTSFENEGKELMESEERTQEPKESRIQE